MFKDVAPEVTRFTPIDPVNRLFQEKAQLERGILAPEGAWIETGMVSGRQWRQAYWRATEGIFNGSRGKVKRKYIGKAGGSEHNEAKLAVANRERLKSVINQLKILGEEI